MSGVAVEGSRGLAGRSRTRRAGLWLIEVLPAFAVALVILPLIIATGTFSPWHPATVDLQVYIAAVQDFFRGYDIYQTSTAGWDLKFIYPPIAAVLMLPMAFGPYAMWQVMWSLLLVGSQQLVLRRAGIPRGWVLGLLGAVVVLAVEPLRTSLGYGQVNTVLMALVVADLLPPRQGEHRWLPRGALLGLAAAIKLTPLLFVVFVWFAGRRRLAYTAAGSFVAWNVLGFIAMPGETIAYYIGLAHGQTNTASPVYTGNQSMLGVITRIFGQAVPTIIGGLILGLLVAALGTLVAAWWWHRAPVFAVGLVGLCTAIASPLSWTHHHVYVILLLASVFLREPLPRWVRYASLAWALWIAACLPLALLPYGDCVECHYNLGQHLVAELGPVLGSIMIIAMALQLVVEQGPALLPAGRRSR